jgi:MFS family permease
VNKVVNDSISPKISLISAFFVHLAVEIPYFIFPVLVLLVGEDLNLGEFMWIGLGTVGTVGTLAAGLPAPLFGWLSDRSRRGVMMCFSLLLSSLGAFIIGFLGSSFLFVVVGFGLIGLGVGLYHPPGLSWVATAYQDKENRVYSSHFNKILGIHGVGGTIGSSIGPISVFFLLNIMSWRQIYLLWSIPLILLVIVFWLFIARFEETPNIKSNKIRIQSLKQPRMALKSAFSHNLTILFVFMILMSLTWGMVNFILSPFLSDVKGFEIADAALFIGITHLFGASGQLFGGVIADKYSEKIALLFASSLQSIILIGIYLLNPPLVLFMLYMTLFVVNAIFWPITNSFLAKNTLNIGSAFGGFILTVNVVRAIGPSIDGFLITYFPSNYLFIFISAIICSTAAFCSLLVVKSSEESCGV